MALSKIEFVNGPLEVFTVQDDKQENWMVANPFAEALGYLNVNRAIRVHVAENNQKTLEELRSDRSGLTDESSPLPRNVQAKTKFINRAGVFELINASEMPAAKSFKQWNTNDLLPKLCQEGEYSMADDAPADIAAGMNAVHTATNEGREAPWRKDLNSLKLIIDEKDKVIAVKDEENKQLVESLKVTNDKLIVFANALVESNKGLMVANDRNNTLTLALISANEKIDALANRMADIAQDVIAKPSDPQLLHSLAVCSMGGDQYAFLRPQKRSLKRSLNRLSVDEKNIVYKSDYVPNAINVLNKVKETLPKDKFKAKNNKITLLEGLGRDDLIEAINSTMTDRQVAIIHKRAKFISQQL
ncbi:bro-b [Malacosoma neustria nucleopolyhedrovirus]|uniref:bro-b n=1 Tax=Malacosoma neustria nuclear polyhedrosis virus TaxID=38012 RepID=UPI000E35F1E7|nr:bro-b [Malacosoma neustria nucleopolyhedrovirus]AUF81619.1 bro-b [Malacosoma neustria nucleopolyhedrovirus]